MKSPRFDIRAAKLRKIFSPSNIERIWKDKVRVAMRDQFLCDGVENLDFHMNRKIESQKLSQLILSGGYTPQKSQRILMEKSKGLCRQLVIPSVRDAIVLQCLSDALYMQIKDKAPTDKAFFEPKDHAFSTTPSPYGTFASWLNFQRALFKFSKNRRFIVVTDIANYYDSISYVHLRNAIASISDVEECVLDMLIYVLADLLWQPDYTPRIEVGLPQINLDAPRLLAHCFLYELDSYLASDANRDFVRYMDDIDIGVDSIVEAKTALKAVDLVLQTKQVRLNSGKTSILSRNEAIRHFRIFENARIDTVQNSVDFRLKHGLPIDRQRTLIEARIKKGIKKKSFDTGNGEKILKRWISLASKTGAEISPATLTDIINRRPAVRQNVYAFTRGRHLKPSIATALANSANSGLLVDDASLVEMANNLVETLVKSRHCHKFIESIIARNGVNDYYGIYSTLWLQSKYGTTEQLLNSLQKSKLIWSPHERLGRLAASFSPIFHKSAEEASYRKLLSSSMNVGVHQVYRFHIKLENDADTFNRMFDSLKAVNPSRGTGITHPKFLCLMSALQNLNVPAAKVSKLRGNHNLAFMDTYYRSIAKRLGV